MSEKTIRPRPPKASREFSPDMYQSLHPSFFDAETPAETTNPDHNASIVIPTANDFFNELTERIEHASDSVDLQFYTLEADNEVSRIIDASIEAAHRGVDVRILVDHLVSDPRRLPATLRADKKINATPNMHMKRARVAEGLAGLAIRDHKKIAAIDTRLETTGGCAYIGGVNLAARSLRWNDFMVRMQGPITHLIQQDFNDSWNGNTDAAKKIADPTEPGTYLLTDSGQNEQIVQFTYERIASAQERIWLETPYFDMTGIGNALCLAKQANPLLDVRVIIPRYNIYPVDRLRANKVCGTLQDAGIDARQYGASYRRLNHAKLLLVDDTAMFGSSNFNSSSLAGKNAEIAVATENPAVLAQLERWYEEDLKESI